MFSNYFGNDALNNGKRQFMAKKTPSATEGLWRTEGFDTFSGDAYSFPGSYQTEREAVEAGKKQLKEIQKDQPDAGEIQDQVWIIRPDGKRYSLWDWTSPRRVPRPATSLTRALLI